ncbi:MAG: zinc-binding dehydrogenase [Anaerolineae bacterium]
MKAAVLTGHGGSEVVTVTEALPIPEPGAGEVRLQMRAAALNRLDLWVRQGWHGLSLSFPHIICSDGAGVVDTLGTGVTGVAPGDRVCIDPSVLPSDVPQDGRENLSRQMHVLGETIPGVAADYVVVPARNLVNLPHHVSFEEGAAAGLVYVTAWHSLVTRGQFTAGETVLIVGAGGGVNSASIQIAKYVGATVYVVGSSAEKCQQALSLGADVTINRAEYPEWSKVVYQMTNKRGVDVVVDNVGQATLPDSLRSCGLGGRVLIVGNTSGPITQIDVRQIFARQLTIMGSTMGPHRDYEKVMSLVFEGKLKPVVGEVLPLDEARAAQEKLEAFEVFGKVVLRMEA